MISLLFTHPLVFFLSFGGLLLSLTIHEFAHAWAADQLGDPTPRVQGRLTINPKAHLDPLGTLALLFTGFGWGRPVMFDPMNLRHPVRDAALIALAGPAVNIAIALVVGILLRFTFADVNLLTIFLVQMFYLNLSLAIFNLVPVYPLDGSKILLALLPPQLAIEYEDIMEKFGMFILIALLFPFAGGISPVSFLTFPIIQFWAKLILGSVFHAIG